MKFFLCGYGPKPSGRLNVEIEIPKYLWDVALVLSGSDKDKFPPVEEYPIDERKAKALATAMGCMLWPDHDWFVSARG